MPKRRWFPKLNIKSVFSNFKLVFKSAWIWLTIYLLWASLLSIFIWLFWGSWLSIYDSLVLLVGGFLIPVLVFQSQTLKSGLFKYIWLLVIQTGYTIGLTLVACYLVAVPALTCGRGVVFNEFLQLVLIQVVILIGLLIAKYLWLKKSKWRIVIWSKSVLNQASRLHRPKIFIGLWIALILIGLLLPQLIFLRHKTTDLVGSDLKLTYPVRDFMPWYDFSKWERFSENDSMFIWSGGISRVSNNPGARILLQVGFIETSNEPLKMTLAQIFSAGSDNRVAMMTQPQMETEARLDYALDLIRASLYQTESEFTIDTQTVGSIDWSVVQFLQPEGQELKIYNRWYLAEIDDLVVIVRVLSIGYVTKAFEEADQIIGNL